LQLLSSKYGFMFRIIMKRKGVEDGRQGATHCQLGKCGQICNYSGTLFNNLSRIYS